MPRANRYIADGLIYHLTHRCHDRSFLLRFAKDRREYRRRLREALASEPVHLLDYCITSNHVHLLAFAEKADAVASLIQRAHGEMARWYNARKGRSGAFWEGRYHCTMVEDGAHFMQCMAYIAMNMIRAGVVRHPAEWEWCGYKEILNEKKRYRLVDRKCMIEQSGAVDEQSFLGSYQHLIEEVLASDSDRREREWTESLAVGSEGFCRRMGETFTSRTSITVEEDKDGYGGWRVREPSSPYGDGADRYLMTFGQERSDATAVTSRKEITPEDFYSNESEKTKFNWFCFEFALEIMDCLGEPLKEEIRGEGYEDEDIVKFCIYYSKQTKSAIRMKLRGYSPAMELSYFPIENYFTAMSDELVDDVLTAVGRAWDRLLDCCVVCSQQCITDRDSKASMFDDIQSLPHSGLMSRKSSCQRGQAFN